MCSILCNSIERLVATSFNGIFSNVKLMIIFRKAIINTSVFFIDVISIGIVAVIDIISTSSMEWVCRRLCGRGTRGVLESLVLLFHFKVMLSLTNSKYLITSLSLISISVFDV